MHQENFPNRPQADRQELSDAEAARMAAHFRVSPNDVRDRCSMAEQQREMTRAYLTQKEALRN